jgi:nicotinamide phosphoribosyltransferase
MSLSLMQNDPRFNGFEADTDLYKYSQWKQLPVGARFVESYMEARMGAKYKQIIPFGYTYALTEGFAGKRITKEGIEYRNWAVTQQMGPNVFNFKGWMDLLEAHDGLLPLKIKAIPEGTVLGIDNALVVIENMDERFPWLTNFGETPWMRTWYPTTVASAQFAKRQMFLGFLLKTGTPGLINYKWVDFGSRGVSSKESACLGGGAHLLSFGSSDTSVANDFIWSYYNDPTHYNEYGQRIQNPFPDKVYMGSIPAMEHSTITTWGREHEADSIANMLFKAFPSGPVACVGDSYDYENFVRNIIGGKFRDEILRREGVVVVRPDSGDPTSMVLKSCKWLGENFGYEDNDKGYKVLNKKVRVIQGDGIDYDSAYDILSAMEHQGWSADNVALGEGGGALQKVNRDTERMALKASAIDIEGVWHDVVKDPKTDPSKASKAGHLAVFNTGNGGYRTVRKADGLIYTEDQLVPIFEMGKIIHRDSFETIQARVREADVTEA